MPLWLAVLGITTSLGLAACTDQRSLESPAAPVSSWAPQPARQAGLTTLATSGPNGFRLSTAGGVRTFLPGVNLGSTTPLHQPGEVGTITRRDFRRWIETMGKMRIPLVRIYTLLPPAFYEELNGYNARHPDSPVYLVQGVYLPNEGAYLEPEQTLFDADTDKTFARELADVSAAVHGDLTRPQTRGQASGRYTQDVSRWLVAWIIGVEWDGEATLRTDRVRAAAPRHRGRYFSSTPNASPTERWLAKHMDALATLEAKRGVSTPIAFVNWPTTDPLKHPTEPLEREDLVGIDANHVLPSKAWPGGTFASFHVYPYYPDFQRYEPGLEATQWRGEADRYAGYLTSLRDHFAGTMPLVISEFGVPSALGSAHHGPRGRDQGGHSERAAMAIDADLMRLIAHLELGGAFVFAWSDEWFKRTWNTVEHQTPTRLQLWHDPLTNEQWFGMIATDPDPLPDTSTEIAPQRGAIERVHAWADASWVHLDVAFRSKAPSQFVVDADVVPGPGKADYRLRVDRGSATMQVRRALDPIRLDVGEPSYRPGTDDAWHTYALITNRTYLKPGVSSGAEYQYVGRLVRGNWNPKSKDYNSLATWSRQGKRIQLRLPWSLLGMADPSSRTALGEGKPAEFVRVSGIRFTMTAGQTRLPVRFDWDKWNYTTYSERPKAGLKTLTDAIVDLTAPAKGTSAQASY
jgi:hypothetical protein